MPPRLGFRSATITALALAIPVTGVAATCAYAGPTASTRTPATTGSAPATTMATKRAPVPTRPGRWVMGYYVGYLKDQRPLDHVDWTSMTHVAVGAAVPHADGTLDTTFYQQDTATGTAWAKAVVDRAHRNGRKAVLMIGGANTRGAFASAASSQNRAVLTRQILHTVDTLGFDGVDIDWEPMVAADMPNAIALGKELKAAKPGLLLTIPVMPVNLNLPQNTIFDSTRDLAGVYDQVNIMTYGMTGGWEGWGTWHSSALYGESSSTPMSVDHSVKAYVNAGIPRAKLGVGIGLFGSCLRGTTAPRQMNAGTQVVADDNVMSYHNIVKDYYRSDRARWDDAAKVPYLSGDTDFGPAGCSYVTYEDARSIAAKADYVATQGLGGAIVWNINEDVSPVQYLRSREVPPTLMSSVGRAFLR